MKDYKNSPLKIYPFIHLDIPKPEILRKDFLLCIIKVVDNKNKKKLNLHLLTFQEKQKLPLKTGVRCILFIYLFF